MIKLSKKSLLLFISALALAAFAMPSMASAAAWDPINTTHTLTSTNLSFTGAAIGGGSTCATASFVTDVSATGTATVTSATFDGCVGTDGLTGCTATATGTGFPWEITAVNTTDVVIDRVDVDVTFSGSPVPPCSGAVTLEGSLTGAWSNTTHTLELVNSPGLTGTAGATDFATVVNGTIRDDQQTLIVT